MASILRLSTQACPVISKRICIQYDAVASPTATARTAIDQTKASCERPSGVKNVAKSFEKTHENTGVAPAWMKAEIKPIIKRIRCFHVKLGHTVLRMVLSDDISLSLGVGGLSSQKCESRFGRGGFVSTARLGVEGCNDLRVVTCLSIGSGRGLYSRASRFFNSNPEDVATGDIGSSC